MESLVRGGHGGGHGGGHSGGHSSHSSGTHSFHSSRRSYHSSGHESEHSGSGRKGHFDGDMNESSRKRTDGEDEENTSSMGSNYHSSSYRGFSSSSSSQNCEQYVDSKARQQCLDGQRMGRAGLFILIVAGIIIYSLVFKNKGK